MTENLPVKSDQMVALVEYLAAHERMDRVIAAAAPIIAARADPAWIEYQLKTAIARTPSIAQCRPDSVVEAVINAVSVGLNFSGADAQGYLVPFRDKAKGTLCQFIPGYQGLILNLHRGAVVTDIEAHVVIDGDKFEFEYGTNRYLKHVPVRHPEALDPQMAWERITHAYAIAQMPNSPPKFEVVSKEYLTRVRASSKLEYGPWRAWPEPMCQKTAVKQLRKVLPIDPETITGRTFALQQAVDELQGDAQAAVEAPEDRIDGLMLAMGEKVETDDVEPSGAPEGGEGETTPQTDGGEPLHGTNAAGVADAADALEPRPLPDDLLAELTRLEAEHSGAFDAACSENGLDAFELAKVEDIPEAMRAAVWNTCLDAMEAGHEDGR